MNLQGLPETTPTYVYYFHLDLRHDILDTCTGVIQVWGWLPHKSLNSITGFRDLANMIPALFSATQYEGCVG